MCARRSNRSIRRQSYTVINNYLKWMLSNGQNKIMYSVYCTVKQFRQSTVSCTANIQRSVASTQGCSRRASRSGRARVSGQTPRPHSAVRALVAAAPRAAAAGAAAGQRAARRSRCAVPPVRYSCSRRRPKTQKRQQSQPQCQHFEQMLCRSNRSTSTRSILAAAAERDSRSPSKIQ